MKLFLLTIFIGLSAAAKLSNTYLPPQSAATAGGHGSFLQGPQHGQRPSNQYVPPQTNYNQHGQPVQWSHGGWNAGQGAGSSPQSFYAGSGGGHLGGAGGGHLGGSGGGSNYHNKQPVIPILKYDSVNDGSGNYHFEYETGNGIHAQEQGHINNPNTDYAENVVDGSFSYTGDDGKQYSVKYEADGNGFRPTGDHLPTPPPQPREIQEVWDKVLAEQAQHAGQGGWQQQGGAHQQGAYQQQGSYQQGTYQQGGFASGSSYNQQQSHHGGAARPQHRPQAPHNQYLPPTSGAGGYQY